MLEENKYKVCVTCKTYNHANFIEETMDGFTMQQTDFPFVCVIIDDASTDGEPEVIKRYLDEHFDLENKFVTQNEETDDYIMTFSQHKTNTNCYFSVYFLKYNHYSIKKPKDEYMSEILDNVQYYALCEGDDYWIGRRKLQEQVDYLEANDDCVLVYTDAIVVNESSVKILSNKSRKREGNCTRFLLTEGNFIITATACYRNSASSGWIDCKNSIPLEMKMGDKPLWIYLSLKGKFHYINKEYVAYRVLKESASHSLDINKKLAFIQNGEELTLFFNSYFDVGVEEEVIKKDYAYTRIRASLEYYTNDYKYISRYYIKRYPTLLLEPKLIVLLLIRLVTRRPIHSFANYKRL